MVDISISSRRKLDSVMYNAVAKIENQNDNARLANSDTCN